MLYYIHSVRTHHSTNIENLENVRILPMLQVHTNHIIHQCYRGVRKNTLSVSLDLTHH